MIHYKNLIFKALLLITCPLVLAQTYQSTSNITPTPQNNTASNKSITANNISVQQVPNLNPNNSPQRLQPNIIVTIPQNTINPGPALKKAQASKPDNPGYDTTSSQGGPSNNQGSVTYGSDGSIKTLNSRK